MAWVVEGPANNKTHLAVVLSDHRVLVHRREIINNNSLMANMLTTVVVSTTSNQDTTSNKCHLEANKTLEIIQQWVANMDLASTSQSRIIPKRSIISCIRESLSLEHLQVLDRPCHFGT